MVKNAVRFYTVGDTVHLRSRVSMPGTKTPADPESVTLKLLRGTTVLISGEDFTREAEGDYTFAVQTVGFTPGSYEVVVTHSSGPERVAIVNDSFVLRAAS